MMSEYFSSCNLVAVNNNNIVGFICALPSVDKKCYFIWQVVVDMNFRGREIAHLLVDCIIKESTLNGYQKIEFSINPENMSSFRLFKRIAVDKGKSFNIVDQYTYEDISENVYAITF